MIDDPLSLLTAIIWLAALAPWPVAFLFGACSPCCQQQCPRMINFDRCFYSEAIGFVDGIETLTGNTQPISLRKTSGRNDRFGPAAGSFPLEIFLAQSEIRISVRISISASGASRTPVGTTRVQVWRFNRPTPTSPPASAYDVLGPAWHLEVELSVTGVDTQEEAGVTTNIGTDSEGQPKLFVVVNQWTATITHDAAVTLFPVGLQRWKPVTSGAGNFALTTLTATATRVSGDNYSGWTVSKLSGLDIVSESLAIRINAVQPVFLHEPTVLDYLNGDIALTVSGSETRILPQNPLCGVVNFGLAQDLGLLPKVVTATFPQSARDNNPYFCEESVALYGGCGSPGFGGLWRHFGGGFASVSEAGGFPGLANFYGSQTILWMMLNSPFRTSFTATVSGVSALVEWGESPGRYQGRVHGDCPVGTIGPYFPLCITMPSEIDLQLPTGTVTVPTLFGSAAVTVTPTTALTLSVSADFSNSPGLLEKFVTDSPCYFAQISGAGAIATIQDWCEDSGTTTVFEGGVNWSLSSVGTFGVPQDCQDVSTVVFPDVYPSNFPGSPLSASYLGPLPGSSYLVPSDGLVLIGSIFWVPGSLAQWPTSADAASWEVRPFTIEPPFTPTNNPGEGPWTLFSFSVDGVIDPGTIDGVLTGSLSAAASQQGACYYGRFIFQKPTNCGTLSAPESDCTPSVSIVSGEEFARVTYLTSGEAAGLIEIYLLRTWLGNQGVTFTVTCNGSTTYRLRRSPTAPTTPRNLTVTRGPCSTAVLEWDVPEYDGGLPITVYRIEFRRIGVSAYTLFGDVAPNVLTATITGLVRVGYEFRVQARNTTGGTAATVIDGFALTAPTGLTHTRESPCTSVTLSWTPPATAECVIVASYLLQFRVFGTTPWTTAATLTGDVVTGTITGLSAGTRYQFRVGSVDEENAQPPLQSVQRFSGIITSGLEPFAPTGVAGLPGSNPGEIDITWSHETREVCFPTTDFNVQFRPDSTSTWTDFSRPASTNTFATVTGLTAGVNYFFRVRAVNAVGNGGFSFQSNPVSIPIPE